MPSLLGMQVEELHSKMTKLNPSEQTFATSLCEQYWSRGLSEKQAFWVGKLLAKAEAPPPPAAVNVGSMSGVLELFAKAKAHLKWPAIQLAVPLTTRANFAIRLSVAGPNARVPGSINVTTVEKGRDGQRVWLGRIHTDGRYEPKANPDLGNVDPAYAAKVADKLKELALNPAATATMHGRLTGNCCFCARDLTDERSVSVGYGPICAGHYGLPWGCE